MLVVNLAIADGISGLTIVASAVKDVIGATRGYETVTVSIETCLYINIFPICAFDAASFTIMAIGFDRLIALKWPVLYKNLKKTYVIVLCAGAWIFGLITLTLGFIFKGPSELVPSCAIPTALKGLAMAFWNFSNIIINILVVVSYTMAYRRAKVLAAVRSSNNEQILRNNRLLTSLVICVAIYISTWAATMAAIGLMNVLTLPPAALYYIMACTGPMAAANVACNFFVYYARSDEYRTAFRKLMKLKTLTLVTVHPIEGSDNCGTSKTKNTGAVN